MSYSVSKTKRYLRWHRQSAPRRMENTPASPLPYRLDFIFVLETELNQ